MFNPKVAFFSMEIGIDTNIPTYSGGLGVLAGDVLRSGADLGVSFVGITLLARHFVQEVDKDGNQSEIYPYWDPSKKLKLRPEKVSVFIGDREVEVSIWEYEFKGVSGRKSFIYFLDTRSKNNNKEDREITSQLYSGDLEWRLKQEIILGVGGVKALRALKFENIKRYHLNEGHSALAIIELIRENKSEENVCSFCDKLVFTTHTPVPAGHDKFPPLMAENLLKNYIGKKRLKSLYYKNELNMTHLALKHSKYINGVALRHGQVSRGMFPNYPINSITNGVHHLFWTSDPLKRVFDKYLGLIWKNDPYCLRFIFSAPAEEIMGAHLKSKKKLINFVNKKEEGLKMKSSILTIGWARRFTLYKRSYLLFMDLDRLKKIAREKGPLQIIFAGEAAPDDWKGKENLKYIFKIKKELSSNPDIKITFIENYNIEVAKLLVSGVDVWLNTPQIPMEASGTSGMKAAMNGVPSLSSLDGWWLEGCVENVTGWSIGKRDQSTSSDKKEAQQLYDKLEKTIIPIYYTDKGEWQKIMQSCIMLNGSAFNSHRMVKQYLISAYLN